MISYSRLMRLRGRPPRLSSWFSAWNTTMRLGTLWYCSAPNICRPHFLHSSPSQILSNSSIAPSTRCGSSEKNACFEVAFMWWLHTHASASKVCRTNIDPFAIYNDYLKVDSVTKNSFQLMRKYRVFIKVFTEIWTWFLGMNQAYLHPFLQQIRQCTQ